MNAYDVKHVNPKTVERGDGSHRVVGYRRRFCWMIGTAQSKSIGRHHQSFRSEERCYLAEHSPGARLSFAKP